MIGEAALISDRLTESADVPHPSSHSLSLLTAKPAPKRLLPWLVAIAFLTESLDTTVLNTAVPAMARAP